jgi:hypothetical protein
MAFSPWIGRHARPSPKASTSRAMIKYVIISIF